MILKTDRVMRKEYHILIEGRRYSRSKAPSSGPGEEPERRAKLGQSACHRPVPRHRGAGGIALLAAFGADVLKVEKSRAPDVMRYVDAGPAYGISTTFAALNAGKKSLAIDLKNSRLRDLLLGMVRDADVFIENFRPGTPAARARLRGGNAVNPRIIYLSISGYGRPAVERLRRLRPGGAGTDRHDDGER